MFVVINSAVYDLEVCRFNDCDSSQLMLQAGKRIIAETEQIATKKNKKKHFQHTIYCASIVGCSSLRRALSTN